MQRPTEQEEEEEEEEEEEVWGVQERGFLVPGLALSQYPCREEDRVSDQEGVVQSRGRGQGQDLVRG